MRFLLVFCLTLSGLHAAAELPKSPGVVALEQRLIGVNWQLVLDNAPEDACREQYVFSDEGILFIASGEEILATAYRLGAVAGSQLVSMRLEHINSNRAPDCQGKITPLSAGTYVRYIKDLPNRGLKLCWRDSEDSCFATLTPLQAEPVI